MRPDGIEPSLDLLLPVRTPASLCHSWIKVQSRSRTYIPDISGHSTLKLSELCDDIKGGDVYDDYITNTKRWAPIGLNYVYWFIRPALKNRRGQSRKK